MSVVLAGTFVLTSFLAGALVLSIAMLAAGSDQADAHRLAAQLRGERMRTSFSITHSSNNSGDSTQVTLEVKNDGAAILTGWHSFDMIASYLNPNALAVYGRLDYQTGTPAASQWSITGLTPDVHNPGLWDPGETATLVMEMWPPLQPDSVVTVVMASPNGVVDSVSFTVQ